MSKKRRDSDAQIPASQMHGTVGQRLVVFVLVVGVGVLFGMGGSMALLQGGRGQIDLGMGISQVERDRHVAMMLQVQELEGGRGYPEHMQQMLGQRAMQQLLFARMADREGLLARGEARRQLLRHFVNRELPNDPGRTIGDALEDRQGSERAIDLDRLAEYLAVNQANEAFSARHMPTPAIDGALGELFLRSQEHYGDRVTLDSVRLSCDRFLPELEVAIAEDDEAIQRAYDDLKFDRFEIPESTRLTVAAADPAAFLDAITIDEDAIVRRYDAERDQRWRQTVEEDAVENEEENAEENEEENAEDVEVPPSYRPLDEVRETIRAELVDETAAAVAEGLIADLDQALTAAGGDSLPSDTFLELVTAVERTPAQHPRLTRSVRLELHRAVRAIHTGSGRQVILRLEDGTGGRLARIDDGAFFFGRDPQAVSMPMAASDQPALRLLVQVVERVPASFLPLDEVREQVIRHLAIERAWPKLHAAAEDLRVAIAESGESLRSYCTDAVLAPWGTTVEERSVAALKELEQAPAERGGFGGQPLVALELAAAPRPVVVLSDTDTDSPDANDAVPALTVAQVASVNRAESSPQMARMLSSQYRRALERYLGHLLAQRL